MNSVRVCRRGPSPVKTPLSIFRAAKQPDGVYAQLVQFIKPGIKENEIVAKIQGWLIEQGVDRITGVNCVSGPRSNQTR